MKYLVILGDGMADEPIPELGDRTPLEEARTPHMDRIARDGCCGLLRTIPEGCEAGSDIANLSILGYDPRRFYTGRGPLEAASMGILLKASDMAYRCNLSTVIHGVMADFSAGHISSAEGASLLSALDREISPARVYPGVSYRNILVLPGAAGATTVPPHDIVGQEITSHLPEGNDAPHLQKCVEASRRVFAGHPVNRDRISRGLSPATQIWPWSGGRTPLLTPFAEKYGKRGGIISAVDLLKGIGRCAGMEIIDVPGATGYLDTDYQAKARYALLALEHLDFVYIHVEAPDEAGHLGSIREKVTAIERVDEMIGTILGEFTGVVAILPDHPTPIRIKTHTADPVPFAILGKGRDSCTSFSEKEAALGKFGVMEGPEFLPLLFERC
ncbi:MAG: cofactor-independent phosphoglycerate mutase [Methanolinea sp.]|jgi:2,3-bisphosphoglycerate-independent phosphoglycerate mutase|nr:cofactor-independent phosphoglycerate mutase [Methanolinea sp.]